MIFTRLPVQSRPGYDCRRDNANCPACSVGQRADHGIFGGGYWFAVAAEYEGTRVVLVLEVMGIHYPKTVPARPNELRRPRGGVLVLHRELAMGGAKCDWMPDGLGCEVETAGYMRATEIYNEFGNLTTDQAVDLSKQSDAFWEALEKQLERWAAPSLAAGVGN